MSEFKVGPYRDLVSKKSRGDERPYLAPEPMSEQQLRFYESEFARIRDTFGTTVDEILAKGDSIGWWQVWVAFGIFTGWKFAHSIPFSDTESMIQACYWISAEVNNGGFHQYFHNTAGDDWPFVMQALVEGKDRDGIRIFEGVMSIFPDGKPDVDRGKRWDQMDQMCDKDEEFMWAHFGKYSKQYYECPFPEESKLVSVIKARKADIALIWPI